MKTELQKEDFGNSGLFRAEVLDNVDPSKLGRIKVNVFGLYDGIDSNDLPWAVPMQPVGPGAGAGFGIFSVPEIGSNVFVMFEGGDIYQPVYIGSAPDGVHGLPSERITSYPNRRVIKTKAGLGVYVDDSARVIRIIHPSGKYIQMDASGNITISAGDVTITGGNITISGTKIEMNP